MSEMDSWDLQRQQFDSNYERIVERARKLHHLVQAVIQDIDYTGADRDDEVWWQLGTIADQNGFPDGITHDDAYNLYRTNYGGEQ
jgi:hypothetical protein